MIARARMLLPRLRDRASRTEELRRLPPETEHDLHDAGLFRMLQPKRIGGSECDYVTLVDCAMRPIQLKSADLYFTPGDASASSIATAWVIMPSAVPSFGATA